jgi:hypothetical protein
MFKASASLLCSMILSGCGGIQWLKPPPPVLPQTAATKCRATEDLCKLPEDFASRSLDAQAALALACHTVNVIEYAKCEIRHLSLIDWAHDVSSTKEPRK